MHGISNTIGETDLIAAQKKIMGEVSQVSQDMTQFIMGSDRGILEKQEFQPLPRRRPKDLMELPRHAPS